MGMNRVVHNGGRMGMDLLMVVQFKAQLSRLGLGSRGTGVFHAPRELLEYNRTNIKGQLYILTFYFLFF